MAQRTYLTTYRKLSHGGLEVETRQGNYVQKFEFTPVLSETLFPKWKWTCEGLTSTFNDLEQAVSFAVTTNIRMIEARRQSVEQLPIIAGAAVDEWLKGQPPTRSDTLDVPE